MVNRFYIPINKVTKIREKSDVDIIYTYYQVYVVKKNSIQRHEKEGVYSFIYATK